MVSINAHKHRPLVMKIGYGYGSVAIIETMQLVDDPKVIRRCMTAPNL